MRAEYGMVGMNGLTTRPGAHQPSSLTPSFPRGIIRLRDWNHLQTAITAVTLLQSFRNHPWQPPQLTANSHSPVPRNPASFKYFFTICCCCFRFVLCVCLFCFGWHPSYNKDHHHHSQLRPWSVKVLPKFD